MNPNVLVQLHGGLRELVFSFLFPRTGMMRVRFMWFDLFFFFLGPIWSLVRWGVLLRHDARPCLATRPFLSSIEYRLHFRTSEGINRPAFVTLPPVMAWKENPCHAFPGQQPL